MDPIKILDVPIHRLTRREATEQFIQLAKSKETHYATTPNAEILLEAQKDPDFKTILQKADLNFPDSVSLLWAGATIKNQYSIFRSILELIFLPIRKPFWKNTFPETVTGSDLYLSICEKAAEQGLSVFLLGGRGPVPQINATKLQERFPTLKIAGFLEGSPEAKYDKAARTMIDQSGAPILLVAFGAPRQEKWIARNLPHLKTVKIAMGIGGSFDFVAGKIKRAPKILQKLGLEWLYRLLQEPRRIKRIWNAVIIFPYVFLKELENLRT